MITKITNTPIYNSAYKFQNRIYNPQISKPQQDTVTFTSKISKTQELVDMAFEKLAQTRNSKNLGNYMGTLGKTNVYLRETEFGKKAQLTIMRKEGFANFELARSVGKPATITTADKDISSENIVSAVRRYIKSIK